MRAKIVTILLVVALILSTMAFSASAANETCRLTVKVTGNGSVTLGETEFDEQYTTNIPVGETVTLTATPDEEAEYGSEFLFWVNTETNRIVCWEDTYTFAAATFASYEAVFDDDEAIMTAQEKHTVVYLTQGDNIIAFVDKVALGDTSYFSSVPTTGVAVAGKTFTGWSKTASAVASTEGRVYVRPTYQNDSSFTVTSIVNGVTTEYPDQKYLSKFTLTAPITLNGQTFSYWRTVPQDQNTRFEIASFYSTYQFIVTGDVTLMAVYDEEYPYDNTGYTAYISGNLTDTAAGTVSIFAEHSVTDSYTVLQHGILLTMNQNLGNFDNLFRIENVVSGANDITTDIIKLTSKDTTRSGSYRANLSGWTPVTENGVQIYPRLFARAYLIVSDANGNTQTYYGELHCVDVNYNTGGGGGTNYDDPFG